MARSRALSHAFVVINEFNLGNCRWHLSAIYQSNKYRSACRPVLSHPSTYRSASTFVSPPSLCLQSPAGDGGSEVWTWRTPLAASKQYWEGWYNGLSEAFLALPVPKMLLLAGTDR